MAEAQPSIDEILAAIKARMSDESPVVASPDRPSVDVAAVVAAAMPALGAVETAGQGTTLEALMRSMLAPMLQSWLDANLPEIVERLAQAEIRRVTGQG